MIGRVGDTENEDIREVAGFHFYCFACYWAVKAQGGPRNKCDPCPVDWNAMACTYSGSEFKKWDIAVKYGEDHDTAKQMAILIRDKEWTDRSIIPESV